MNGRSSLPIFALQVLPQHAAAVFVIVAPDAEVLPVAPVGGIVVMIPVPMVHREEVQIGEIELAAALGADPPMYLQGLLPVIGGRGLLSPHAPHHLVKLRLGLCRRISRPPRPECLSHLPPYRPGEALAQCPAGTPMY